MARRWEVLGQLRPADANAATLYQANANENVVGMWLYIANTGGATPSYRVFIDAAGTTYDETTAIAWNMAMAANVHEWAEVRLPLISPAGSVGVRTSAGNEITFTLVGEIEG